MQFWVKSVGIPGTTGPAELLTHAVVMVPAANIGVTDITAICRQGACALLQACVICEEIVVVREATAPSKRFALETAYIEEIPGKIGQTRSLLNPLQTRVGNVCNENNNEKNVKSPGSKVCIGTITASVFKLFINGYKKMPHHWRPWAELYFQM